ncbi:hypothetical protein B1813_00885 [Saccharomonospora piscinae]|uniref:Uncharacterized protein n=1 Tax=Saccharomonospora piscinae TaxID=687388 RepID=A0A1V9AC45_SACPI|nr:methyltransferase [Saccharomonospora piscinae]OQO94692.1 hypothetical protein B1813_00885 [Saccharomonospora piscinae]TLW94605.1 methyltransferase [Saccharomonospora piscinae]
MPGPEHSPPSVLDIVFGYTAAPMMNVAARLEIADKLADGMKTSSELALATETHEPSMYRLLRALACFGVVTHTESDTFELGPAGSSLRSDSPDSVRSMVMLLCAEETWRSWGRLEHSVRTGDPAWDQVNGISHFDFLAQHPEHAETFNSAMAEYTKAATPGIVERYDFSRFSTLADIGGGDGTLLAAILKSAPAMRGTLFDLPAGIEGARRTLENAGVADRADIVSGDFFSSIPAGPEACVLKSVLHDWDDRKCVEILRRCREAMPGGGTVLVIEPVLPPHVSSPSIMGVVMSDLNMLVNTGGRERTEAEFRALFSAAGLSLTSLTGEGTDFCVLEATPA